MVGSKSLKEVRLGLRGIEKTTWLQMCIHSQFLMPINSSMRPWYVNCVNNGVIISTCRSRIIRESNGGGGFSTLAEATDCSGRGLVKSVASF